MDFTSVQDQDLRLVLGVQIGAALYGSVTPQLFRYVGRINGHGAANQRRGHHFAVFIIRREAAEAGARHSSLAPPPQHLDNWRNEKGTSVSSTNAKFENDNGEHNVFFRRTTPLLNQPKCLRGQSRPITSGRALCPNGTRGMGPPNE